MKRVVRTRTWRLRLQVDRLRRRLWPGLIVAVWFGCAHPRATPLPPRVAANLVPPVVTTPHDEFRAVTVGNQQMLCAIRVGVDGQSFLLWPPMNHPARPACETAYQAWQRSR